MRFRTIILLFFLLPVCSLFTTATFAQSTDSAGNRNQEKPAAPHPKLAVKLFEVKYRHPRSLRDALVTLLSGVGGADINANDQIKTLTVRDYPENIAVIEEAIKRLDVPEPPPVSLELQLHLISASMVGPEKNPFPKSLDPIIVQLKSALKFTNYRYVGSTLNRVSDGGKLEFSGVTGSFFPTPAGVANTPENPAFYSCGLQQVRLTQDASGRESVEISNFRFGVSVPVKVAAGNQQYREIGIVTPISLREGEMAVVGTANVSSTDEAIIVVVSIKKLK